MANSVLKSTALKMTYDFGMIGDKKVVKSQSVNNIRLDATDDQLLAFANAIFAVQAKTGVINRVNIVNITN